MFDSIDYLNLLYLDIETAGIAKYYEDLSDEHAEAWEYYCRRNKLLIDDDADPILLDKIWQENVALVPEFLMVTCVSLGEYKLDDSGNLSFNTHTYHMNKSKTEKEVLADVKKFINNNTKNLVAHAGKDFDYQVLIKRMLINDMLPPACLQIINKKPWEIKLLDTKEIWKFGGMKSASLLSLCTALGIRSSKENMSGSDAHPFFWNGKYEDIAKYCSNDVRALALVLQRICLTGTTNKTYTRIDYIE